MFWLLQGKSRKKGHCKNRRKGETQKEHERNLRRREEKRKRHEENVKQIEKRRREHRENLEKYNKRKKEHEENVKEVERREREHRHNVEEVERKKHEHDNNVREIERRKEEHDKNVQKINERNKQHDENVREIERRKKEHEENVREIERRKKEHEENVKKWIKANYRRKSGEDITEYYKRVCINNVKSDDEYIERISSVRSLFPDLDLWYDEQYLSETQYYYTLVYSMKDTETEEEYFERLFRRECYESEENFAKRVNVLRSLFPSLRVWYDKEYYEKFTRPFYETFYKKKETETIEAYLNRVCTQSSLESEDEFWRRILLIQETFPDYEYWYNKQYLDKLELFEIISNAKSELELEELIYDEKESWEDEQLLKIKLQCLRKLFDSTNSRSEEYSQVKNV